MYAVGTANVEREKCRVKAFYYIDIPLTPFHKSLFRTDPHFNN